MYWILFIGIAVISYIAQKNVNSKFEKYSREYISLTGAQVAQKMLNSFGIRDVKIERVQGTLTDHYDPSTKTLRLSEPVYDANTVAAAAVAAHECGHAVQHATAYSWLSLRSWMVPAVSFSSRWCQWVLLGGILLLSIFNSPTMLLIGIIMFAISTLFSFVTLPVEINASSRALAWLDKSGITSYQTHEDAKSALKAAAYTYVVAALSSLATLLYYISIFTGRSDD